MGGMHGWRVSLSSSLLALFFSSLLALSYLSLISFLALLALSKPSLRAYFIMLLEQKYFVLFYKKLMFGYKHYIYKKIYFPAGLMELQAPTSIGL